jgi:hypothetical protein
MKIFILLSIIITSVTNAAVTMTSVNVLGFNDENGLALGGGILGIAVVDTGNDGFGAIQAGSTLETDTFIGDGNDLIVRVVNSGTFPSVSIQAGFSTNLVTSTPTGVASQGDQFIVYWFPDLSVSNNVTTAGDVYGAARESNWVLTADGTSTSVTTVNPAGNANFIVQDAIPEPSSVALICLGTFGLIARRRRA